MSGSSSSGSPASPTDTRICSSGWTAGSSGWKMQRTTRMSVLAPIDPGIDGPAARPEQTRARYPDRQGYVERDGARLFYEVYGTGSPSVVLLPTWSLIHSRFWKA